MPHLIAIEDTRTRDDHGRIVPDSGDKSPCGHCGRAHDVHYVLSDGRRVGNGCACKILGADSLVPEPRYQVLAGTDLIGEPAKMVSRHATVEAVEAAWPVASREHRATWRRDRFPREYAVVCDTWHNLVAGLWSCGHAHQELTWKPNE